MAEEAEVVGHGIIYARQMSRSRKITTPNLRNMGINLVALTAQLTTAEQEYYIWGADKVPGGWNKLEKFSLHPRPKYRAINES